MKRIHQVILVGLLFLVLGLTGVILLKRGPTTEELIEQCLRTAGSDDFSGFKECLATPDCNPELVKSAYEVFRWISEKKKDAKVIKITRRNFDEDEIQLFLEDGWLCNIKRNQIKYMVDILVILDIPIQHANGTINYTTLLTVASIRGREKLVIAEY